jgi:hypothetical protein
MQTVPVTGSSADARAHRPYRMSPQPAAAPRPPAALLDYAVLAALICVATWLLIGDFAVRLANTSSDEGLIGYAYFFRDPALFRHDAHMTYWGPAALASMMNWLPAALFKYAGVPPEIFHWLFVFAQNVLLALAIYRFATVTSGSRAVAWLAALFVLAFRPHWWNIGLFADLDWVPYAAWLALPLLVYAAGFALEGRLIATAAALLAGGLVHPVHGLFATAMIGGYWALLWLREGGNRELLIRAAALIAVTAAYALPVLVSKSGMIEAPLSEVLPKLINNGHVNPWASAGCSYCLPTFLRNASVVLIVAALAVVAVRRADLRPRTGLFLAACIAVTAAGSALHALAYVTESVPLLRVVGTRASALLLACCVPLAIALAWRMFLGAEPALRLAAAFLLVFPSPATMLAALLLFAMPAGAAGRLARAGGYLCQTAGAVLFTVVLARHVPKLGPRVDLYLLQPVLGTDHIPMAFGYQTIQFPVYSKVVAVLLAAMVLWQVLSSTRRGGAAAGQAVTASPWLWGLLAAMIAAYLMRWNMQSGRLATSGEPREYYEVQAWVRTATAANASFIVGHTSVYEGWRSLTRHPAIAPHAVCAVYFCPVEAVARDRKMEEFYARVRKSSYIDLDAGALREFARIFGGDYAVRRKAWGALDLPVAYENARYVVYDLR